MKNIAFLFPGQGSQYIGMAKSLCSNYKVAREIFEEANSILQFDLKRLCFEGDLDTLTLTVNAQPAILATSISLYKVFMEECEITPNYFAGNSLGEISALTCAGSISFSDAIKIVKKRGMLMQDAVAVGLGVMAAINGVNKEIISEVCEGITTENNLVVISSYNSLNQTVISGHSNAVMQASNKLISLGAKVRRLNVSAPFHSPLMAKAAEGLKNELVKYKYKAADVSIISNVTALPYLDDKCIVENLTLQFTKPVLWQHTIDYIINQGVNTFIELGPRTVLRDLIKKDKLGVKAFSFDDKRDSAALYDEYSNKRVEDKSDRSYYFINRCMAAAVSTRNRNWNETEYQNGVVESYKAIKQINIQLEANKTIPTDEQVKTAFRLLKKIFDTKMVPHEEQVERIEEIIKESGHSMLHSYMLQ